jgi:hypothetical protein
MHRFQSLQKIRKGMMGTFGMTGIVALQKSIPAISNIPFIFYKKLLLTVEGQLAQSEVNSQSL